MNNKRKPIIQRILSQIVKNSKTGCWNFVGYCNAKGYGRITTCKGKSPAFVHRYSYWYYNIKPLGTTWKEFSENNQDLEVCHRCDNPPCCNPKHLFLGTAKDNSKDSLNKNRKAKGDKIGTSKLTEKQVLKIYRMKGTRQEIADKFGIHHSTVTYIKNGTTWSYLTNHSK